MVFNNFFNDVNSEEESYLLLLAGGESLIVSLY